jgi:hypothetical protein
VGSIAGCAIDGTGAKLPAADAIINDDNGPMSFIVFPSVDIFTTQDDRLARAGHTIHPLQAMEAMQAMKS